MEMLELEKLKLNYDPTPEEKTISPDKNCDICYGRGIMKVLDTAATGKYNIFHEKECQCITRRRINRAREKHSKQFKTA